MRPSIGWSGEIRLPPVGPYATGAEWLGALERVIPSVLAFGFTFLVVGSI